MPPPVMPPPVKPPLVPVPLPAPMTQNPPNLPPIPPPPAVAPALGCPLNARDIDGWLPMTPPPKYFNPAPHPQTECPFYQFSFQNFLIATQPDASGSPAFLKWNTLENTFGEHAGEPGPEVPIIASGITQAGGRQNQNILVDQNGNAIRYGIHFNQRFVNFVYKNKLTTGEAIKAADRNLKVAEADVIELKSAWQVVPTGQAVPNTFITTKAKIAAIKNVNGQLVEDRADLRDATLILVALHVVFTIPGHPEFIWSTFEHKNLMTGATDLAPYATRLPSATGANNIINQTNHLLYRGGTRAGLANKGNAVAMFDQATQRFAAATNIFRAFPGSLSHQPDLDEDVVNINEFMTAFFATQTRMGRVPAVDRRGHYQMVGAIWLDRSDRDFAVDKKMVNDYTDPEIQAEGPESPKSITGGEDRLSSTAIESFTQDANSFPNCLDCHNTQAATENGVPLPRNLTGKVMLEPKAFGVSHVFNEVVRLGM
jgi:hypothetical protein